MIYNLYLNSYTNSPLTNYYSAESASNRGQRVYAVDWTFLPEDKNYKVSFKFISRGETFNANNIYTITAQLSPISNSISAGATITRPPNNILGIIKPRQVSSSTDVQLSASPKDNEPIMIYGRPNNNFLEVKIMDTPTSQYNLTVDYLMILSFEEVEK